jgi:hypothetical protein
LSSHEYHPGTIDLETLIYRECDNSAGKACLTLVCDAGTAQRTTISLHGLTPEDMIDLGQRITGTGEEVAAEMVEAKEAASVEDPLPVEERGLSVPTDHALASVPNGGYPASFDKCPLCDMQRGHVGEHAYLPF